MAIRLSVNCFYYHKKKKLKLTFVNNFIKLLQIKIIYKQYIIKNNTK